MTRRDGGLDPGAAAAIMFHPDLVVAARAAPRQECTAATPEEVDLVAGLGALARLIGEHSRRVMCGEPHDWSAVADALAEASRACRQVGDSGAAVVEA